MPQPVKDPIFHRGCPVGLETSRIGHRLQAGIVCLRHPANCWNLELSTASCWMMYVGSCLLSKGHYALTLKQVLVVKGKIIDTITSLQVSPYSDQLAVVKNLAQHTNIWSWLDDCARLIQNSPKYGSGADAEEVLWRTLIHDSTNPNGFDTPSEIYGVSFRAYREFLSLGIQPSVLTAEELRSRRESLISELELFHMSLGNFMPGRQTCSTESGYIGCSSLNAHIKDRICVFQGYPIPFVIRPTGRLNNYELIGEAYLHGLMKGDALKSDHAPLEMIRLS